MVGFPVISPASLSRSLELWHAIHFPILED